MPDEREGRGPGVDRAPLPSLHKVSDSADNHSSSHLAQELGWRRDQRFCVGCGESVLAVAYGLCGGCLLSVAVARFCWSCGADNGPEIDRSLLERVRGASWDVNDAWRDGGYYERSVVRLRVAAERERWAS